MAGKKEWSDSKGYAELLKDEQVERWFDNLARGSPITAEVYLRRLGAFCKRYHVTPSSFLKLGQKGIKNMLFDLVSDLSKEKKAGSYIHSNVKALKSWLSFNDKEVKIRIKIEGAQETPTLKKERVPTREELQKIFEVGDNKQRVACALMAHAGLRPESMGTFRGEDGLKISDFPELKLANFEVSFEKIPAIIWVRENLSKAGHRYPTFLTEEGCKYLTDYLEERLRLGEKLDGESPIITPKRNRVRPHVATTNIGDMVRVAIRRAGFEWRPYVLRAYFDTQLMVAESRGLVIRDYRTFWMGHKGDIENRYTTNKGRLPPNLVEDMRASFKKASQHLETGRMEASEEQVEKIKQDLMKEMEKTGALNGMVSSLGSLPVKGPPVSELYEAYRGEHRLERELTIEEKTAIIEKERDRLVEEMKVLIGIGEKTVLGDYGRGSPAGGLRKARAGEDDDPQMVIDESELPRHLENGWSFVSQLNSGKVVVRK